ncbi:hypothetical protein AC1031_019278 [Aphanomyces cochlioides]|nr:hypothetical protein AC1031_019278 [Aphanomyces cochlioides]
MLVTVVVWLTSGVLALLVTSLAIYVGYYCCRILWYACWTLAACLRALFFLPLDTSEQPVPSANKPTPSNSVDFFSWLFHVVLFFPRLILSGVASMLESSWMPLRLDSPPTPTKSSTSPLPPTKTQKNAGILCQECRQVVPGNEILRCGKCSFVSCGTCFCAHQAERINNGQVSFVCIRCYCEMDSDILQAHLPASILTKMERFRHLDQLTLCPECNMRMKQSGMSKRRMACLGCHRAWCYDCRQPFHLFTACTTAKTTKDE